MKFDMRVTSHIQTNRPDLIKRANWDATEFGARLISRLAKKKAPVRTGRLRDSIDFKKTGIGFEIGPKTDYDIYVEFGTQAHWIYPRSARALRWIGSDGKVHFATKVHHPGSRAQPYLRPALDEARRPIATFLAIQVRKALR